MQQSAIMLIRKYQNINVPQLCNKEVNFRFVQKREKLLQGAETIDFLL